MARPTGWSTLVAASIGVAVSTLSAHAASDLCSQLEAQLAAGPAVGGGSAHFSKYDAAISQQRQQLLLAHDRTAEAGCGFSMVGAGIRYCANLNARIERMERNLDKLQHQRDKASTRARGVKADRQLLALLEANGCHAGESTDNADLIEEIFGAPVEEATVREPDRRGLAAEDAETSDAPADFKIIAGKPAPAEGAIASPPPSSSIVIPDVATPPKPVAQKQQIDIAGEDTASHQPDPNRRVRVVGPAFLPDPEAAIDLQAQDPIQGR